MATNLEIVTYAFVKIGIVDALQAPTAEQGQTGLNILNDYLLGKTLDGMRIGWYKQTDLAATAPLRDEYIGHVKLLLCGQLAPHFGITIEDVMLIAAIGEAERILHKASLRYTESDLGELQRAQGGPWGGANMLG